MYCIHEPSFECKILHQHPASLASVSAFLLISFPPPPGYRGAEAIFRYVSQRSGVPSTIRPPWVPGSDPLPPVPSCPGHGSAVALPWWAVALPGGEAGAVAVLGSGGGVVGCGGGSAVALRWRRWCGPSVPLPPGAVVTFCTPWTVPAVALLYLKIPQSLMYQRFQGIYRVILTIR